MGLFVSAETPEGHSVGVVKNLSYMTHVTIPSNSAALYDFTEPYITPFEDLELDHTSLKNGVKVFVNGCWLGNAAEPLALTKI